MPSLEQEEFQFHFTAPTPPPHHLLHPAEGSRKTSMNISLHLSYFHIS